MVRDLVSLALWTFAIACGGAPPATNLEPATPAPAPPTEAAAPPAAPAATPAASAEPRSSATASLFAIYDTKDLTSFETALDADLPKLRQLGVVAIIVSRNETSPHQALVHYIARDRAAVQRLANAAPVNASDAHPVATTLIQTTDEEYHAPSPWPAGDTFSVYAMFRVQNFETWKANYDEHRAWREQLGVIAHGVHRSIGDDRTVVLHVISTELDSIRLLLDAPDFKSAAQLDGVEGEPKVVLAKDVRRTRL